MRNLTTEDIIETTGLKNLDVLEELEILFLTFNEISSLDSCCNLKKLTLLNNGIQRISNLSPVAMTLTSLCICDQDISVMENLELPMLRDLFMHRNKLKKIGSLSGCPRLRRLWLFQNMITSISSLQSTPELSECWLQGNMIASLSGFENNSQLQNIGLAGNLISDFRELKKLAHCKKLADLSLSDIHFGRCPIVDEDGYKDFVILNLKQVMVLDGVRITKERQAQAEDAYFSHYNALNESLQEIEDDHQKAIRQIESQHQTKENFSQVLEKEMGAALKELQSLVFEGRSIISKQVQRQQSLLDSNFKVLSSHLSQLERAAELQLQDNLQAVREEFDNSAYSLHILEQVAHADAFVLGVLSSCPVPVPAQNSYSKDKFLSGITSITGRERLSNNKDSNAIIFQTVNHSSADFQMMSHLLGCVDTPTADYAENNAQHSANPNLTQKQKRNSASTGTSAVVNRRVDNYFELVKLYKVSLSGTIQPNLSVSSSETVRVFTIIPPKLFVELFTTNSWAGNPTSHIFCENPELLGALHNALSDYCFETPVDPEYLSILSEEDKEWTDMSISNIEESSHERALSSSTTTSTAGRKGPSSKGAATTTTTTTTTSGTTTSGAGNDAKSNSKPYKLLRDALKKKVNILLCCRLQKSSFFPTVKNESSERSGITHVPSSLELKRELLAELKRIKKPQKIDTDFGHVKNVHVSDYNSLYVVPSSACDVCVATIEFVCVCIHPPIIGNNSGVGYKNLESKLAMELQALPTYMVDRPAEILSTFERQAANEVSHYMDKLLEEVDESQAAALKAIEDNVNGRDVTLKVLRDEVEKERRGQDVLLRDLRQQAASVDAHGMNNNNTNNNSATNLRKKK